VVAASPLRRAGWGVAAGLAGAALVALALHGQRPDSSLARFDTAGVMTAIQPADVVAVQVTAGERAWRFRRAGERRWALADGAPTADPSDALERGLRFLHVSAPQRVLERDEVTTPIPDELGLAPPRYVVAAHAAAGASFTIEFGSLNAQGLAQYARVRGGDAVFLLPRFVGEPWETAIGLR
jgi:hypothetical protein